MNPRHVYHNYAIAIDEGRQLFNGAPVKHLRRDPHEAGASCWMHGSGWCLSTD